MKITMTNGGMTIMMMVRMAMIMMMLSAKSNMSKVGINLELFLPDNISVIELGGIIIKKQKSCWPTSKCAIPNFPLIFINQVFYSDQYSGADLAFFQGGGLTQRRCGASSTSRVAASRFFWCYFEPP